MPNPYAGNDEAAWFVDYYASPRMTHETVHRLYTYGVQQHAYAQRRAEEKAYPPQPTVQRTRAEMERYLHDRVQGELLRRQQHRAALRRQYEHAADGAGVAAHAHSRRQGGDAAGGGGVAQTRRCLTEKELQRHLRKLYVEPMRRRAQLLQQQQQQQRYAALTMVARNGSGDGDDAVAQQQQQQLMRLWREREAGWRPPSAHIAHRDDGAQLLVSQAVSPSRHASTPRAGVVASPASRSASAPAASSATAKTTTATTQSQQHDKSKRARRGSSRLAELAKPLHVTPRVVAAARDADAPPDFHVPLKQRA